MKNLGDKIFGALSNNSFGINLQEYYCQKRWEVIVQDGSGSPILHATNCNDEALDCNTFIPQDGSTTTQAPQTTPPPGTSQNFRINTPAFTNFDPTQTTVNFYAILNIYDTDKYIQYLNRSGLQYLIFSAKAFDSNNFPIVEFSTVGPIDPSKKSQSVLIAIGWPTFTNGETYTIIVTDVFNETSAVQYKHIVF